MITNLNEFITASKSFSMPDGKIEANEKGRLEFISKFPMSSIQSLKVDEYCIGTGKVLRVRNSQEAQAIGRNS